MGLSDVPSICGYSQVLVLGKEKTCNIQIIAQSVNPGFSSTETKHFKEIHHQSTLRAKGNGRVSLQEGGAFICPVEVRTHALGATCWNCTSLPEVRGYCLNDSDLFHREPNSAQTHSVFLRGFCDKQRYFLKARSNPDC